jgi:hypothetical protein
MLSSVLRSKRALQRNIVIIRAFVRLREIFATHKDLAHAIEEIRRRQDEQGEQITSVIETRIDYDLAALRAAQRLFCASAIRRRLAALT